MATPAFHIPGVALRFSVNNFFDRQAVRDALTDMDFRALSKASMRVKDHAKQLIKKKGLARPQLKVMKDNPGVSLGSLLAIPGLPADVSRKLKRRIVEIKTKPPSKAGTPPHTHVSYGHMLGFRRNLYNFFDHSSRTAVVGPSRKGKMLPYLHEFGGAQVMQAWQWVNIYPSMTKEAAARVIAASRHPSQWRLRAEQMRAVPAYLMWMSAGDSPRDGTKWKSTGKRRRMPYPARPFMWPALMRAVQRGDLQRAFQGAFRAAAHGRGVMIRRP